MIEIAAAVTAAAVSIVACEVEKVMSKMSNSPSRKQPKHCADLGPRNLISL